jgi:hypothetical protein
MSPRSATVIPLPLSVVESNLWDVTAWPAFLDDVVWVQRIAHERYVFGVRLGRRVHEVPVAVRWRARDHRVTWRELEGPPWRGELRLASLNGRRTRVALSVLVRPRSLVGKLVGLVVSRPRDLDPDLARLAARLSSIPQPFNPARSVPARRIGRRVPVPRTPGEVPSRVADGALPT